MNEVSKSGDGKNDKFVKEALIGMACVVLPYLLRSVVSGISSSWAFVIGIFVGCVLAYLFPPRAKVSFRRWLLVTTFFCVVGYAIGKYLTK
jgi:xanthine/uracil permease